MSSPGMHRGLSASKRSRVRVGPIRERRCDRSIDLALEWNHEIDGAIECLPSPRVEFRRGFAARAANVDLAFVSRESHGKPYLLLSAERREFVRRSGIFGKIVAQPFVGAAQNLHARRVGFFPQFPASSRFG